MDKIIALAIGAAVIVGGGSFYGGMKFQQSRGSIYFTGGFQNLRNLSPEERQDRIQQMGGSVPDRAVSLAEEMSEEQQTEKLFPKMTKALL